METRYTLKMSDEEIHAINDMKRDMDAMIGGADEEADNIWAENVRIITAMFKKNKIVFNKRRRKGVIHR